MHAVWWRKGGERGKQLHTVQKKLWLIKVGVHDTVDRRRTGYNKTCCTPPMQGTVGEHKVAHTNVVQTYNVLQCK